MDDKITIMIVDDEPLIRKAIKFELNERHAMVDCRIDDDGRVQRKEIVVTDTFASGPQLFAALNSNIGQRPDYLLVDMEFQGEPTGGIFIAERVRRQYKTAYGQDIKIIILSGRFDNPLQSETDRLRRVGEIGGVVFEALHKGANAFVSKNAVGGFSIDNIVQAVSSLERGERYFFNYPVMLTLMEAAELFFERENKVPLDEPLNDEEREILLLEAAGSTAQEIAQRLSRWSETDKSVQEKQKEISRKFGIVNKSGARIAKAIQHGIINPADINYLKR